MKSRDAYLGEKLYKLDAQIEPLFAHRSVLVLSVKLIISNDILQFFICVVNF